MAITVKRVELWNVVVDNEPGALARVLKPLAEAGADLEIVMGTSIPGDEGKASVGVFPIKGRKVIMAAKEVGFAPAESMPSLLVGGENRAGIGRKMSEALANAGINIGVAVAQVVGTSFSAVFGFAKPDEATKAIALLKKAGAASRTAKPAQRAKSKPAASKPAARKTTAAKQPVTRAAKKPTARASNKPVSRASKPISRAKPAASGKKSSAASRRSR